jgi:Xaa-Pro aminopeptidase
MPISTTEFSARRQALMAQMDDNSIAIISSAESFLRNGDAEYPYRQSSDFFYLTGFNEPEAMAVLIPGSTPDGGEFVLFCRDRDPAKEIWAGKRAGQEGAQDRYGADQAFSFGDINQQLPELLAEKTSIYYNIGVSALFDQQVVGWLNAVRAKARTGVLAPSQFVDVSMLLREMRLIKSEAEQQIMRRAGEISAQAHCQAMRVCQPGMMEYQLEAEFLYAFAKNGSKSPAYTTIVGGGANGCILHYIENDQVLKDGDLVLIDAGCELEHYAADITRTFPVNGVFNAEQKALYELCLKAQLAAIEVVKPGVPWNRPHEVTVEVITEGLVALGLLTGSVDGLIESQAYTAFYMHRAGHWLGMDVHDVGDYRVDGEWRPLQPGMALTIEPGIYVAPDNLAVEERWRGIGIRIEDDILVTADGCENLTAAVPKTIAEIEALMAAAND